ncbi:MAG: membrane dipeptidase [Gemmatimonadetes bacterium]|nr:membrane dipeptidase [Gemmatimonadota bacterium]
MRTLLIAVGLVVGVATSAMAQAAGTDAALVERARAIHERVTTLDTHVDINPGNFLPGPSNYVTGLNTQVDLPKMEQGGLDAVFFSIFQGQQDDFTPEGYRRPYETAIAKVRSINRLTTELAPSRIGLAVTADDVRRLQAEGKKVALMGMENGYALGEDIANVKKFADMGIRYLSLAHNGHSQLADSNTGERDGYRWNGLSPLGRQVVPEANRWGIMLDISHPSKQANLQTMQMSRAPVIASHSAARALANHSRNLDDEQLRALRRNGGVVQIVAFNSYLKIAPPSPQRQQALAELREAFGLPAGGGGGGGGGGRGGGGGGQALQQLSPERRAEYDRRLADIDRRYPAPPRANVRDLVNHIDHVVKLIGIDHVGISSDFDGGGGIDGWDGAAETFSVTLELVRRGYTEEQIAKIWSGNLLRVLGEVQRVAAEIQREGRD